MSEILAPLTIDFLSWIAVRPRDYSDVMDGWRTSCPRLTIWEDAIDARLVTHVHAAGQPMRIALTKRGRALLANRSERPARKADMINRSLSAAPVAGDVRTSG